MEKIELNLKNIKLNIIARQTIWIPDYLEASAKVRSR